MSKFICFAAILVLTVSAADEHCVDRVKIEQAPTGRSAKSMPEWKVNVTNECFCGINHMTLACPNLGPSAVVNPAGLISIDGNNICQISFDSPLHKSDTVSFTYVWDRVDFKALDLRLSCS